LATIINKDSVEMHAVNKYNYKVLSMGAAPLETTHQEIDTKSKENPPTKVDKEIDSSAISQSSKDALIESLMNKTDEMSSNFIKLQMKLESKEEEYKAALEQAKEISFNEGLEAGKVKGLEETQTTYSKSISHFSLSVTSLEKSATEFEKALEEIKNSLVLAALDIAKEVIKVELKRSSHEVAKALSHQLIKDLQSASKITLKVNPKDHGAISESVGSLKHVEVLSDSAVSEGGVIVMSDAGNIDAQISKRFERVKKAALGE